jgi:putative two-component system response regulator
MTKMQNPNAASSTPANLIQATVLIADNDSLNLSILCKLLQPHYAVLSAVSGELALQFADGTPKPDLILLDVLMPSMDGYEVLARLRNNPVTRDIPVIFITGLDSIEDEEKGLQLGAVDYITKPYRAPIILARVHTQLEFKRARDLLCKQNVYLEAEVEKRLKDSACPESTTAIREDGSHWSVGGGHRARDQQSGCLCHIQSQDAGYLQAGHA